MAASSGDAHPFPIWNARFRVVAPLLDADGDPVSPSSPDSEASQDQGTFADCTNEATEIATSSGVVYLDLTAAEMDTKCTTVRIQSTGAKTTVLTLYPVRLPVLRTGTAQAGGSSTITLDSGASAKDDFYNGCIVNITNDSPANALGQARRITDYAGSTKVATVEAAWGTNPSSASTFEVLLTSESCNVVAVNANPLADWGVAGVPKVDVSHVNASAHNNLVSGRVDASVGAMAADVVTASAIADGAIDAGAIASDAIAAAKIASGAITAAKFAAGAIDAAAIAAAAIDEATFAADTAKYQAKVWFTDDTSNDRYVVCWFKNGQPITSGITSPTIQVIKAADGTDLVASTAMTEIGSLGLYRYVEGTNRIVDGVAYIAKVQASIDSATRTWYQPVSRSVA